MENTNKPAVYVVLKKNYKVFLVLRDHTGFMDGYYSLPSGRIEKAESYMSGGVRVLLHNSGVKITEENLRHIFTAHRYAGTDNTWTDVYFLCEKWDGDPYNAEPAKHSSAGWFDIDKLPINMMEYQKVALQGWLNGQSYTEVGW